MLLKTSFLYFTERSFILHKLKRFRACWLKKRFQMNPSKALSALCYGSIFFSPLLFPIIVFFLSQNQIVKFHAKRSFYSHLIPTLIILLTILLLSLSFTTKSIFTLTPFYFLLLLGFINITVSGIVFIWNIWQAIKILQQPN